MNEQNQIVPTTKREIRVVEDSGPLANLFDSARFEHLLRIASVMAGASLIPDHMWKDKSGNLPPEMVRGNCFLVVNQAIRWGMDPFAVVPCTYVVGGKLGFEGKLVAAVVNSKAPIKSSLDYEFSGTKGTDNFTVRVFATLKGEDKPREIKLSVGEAKTDNKMWVKDPEQKLVYSGATKWARRHCPEIILGVLTEEDLEIIALQEKNITPAPRAKAPKLLDASPSNSSTEGRATLADTKEGADAVSSTDASTQKTVEKSDAVSGNQVPPVAKSPASKPAMDTAQPPSESPVDKLEKLMLNTDITFAQMKPIIKPNLLCASNAKGLDDLSDANVLKIIADFDIIASATKAESAP